MRISPLLLSLAAALLAAPVAAQLSLPGVPGVNLPQAPPLELPGAALGRALDGVEGTLARSAERLLDLRAERIERLVRRNRDTIELDAQGAPARRGELLLLDPAPAALGAAQAAGF